MLIGLSPPQSPTTLLIASQPTKRIVAETSSSPLFGAVSKCHQCCKCTLSKKHPFPPCLAFSWSQFSCKPQACRLLGCLNLFFCKDNSDVDVSTIFGFPTCPTVSPQMMMIQRFWSTGRTIMSPRCMTSKYDHKRLVPILEARLHSNCDDTGSSKQPPCIQTMPKSHICDQRCSQRQLHNDGDGDRDLCMFKKFSKTDIGRLPELGCHMYW